MRPTGPAKHVTENFSRKKGSVHLQKAFPQKELCTQLENRPPCSIRNRKPHVYYKETVLRSLGFAIDLKCDLSERALFTQEFDKALQAVSGAIKHAFEK